jgi:hypothetical protein
MDIFNQGKELLQDVFYTDVRHFKNFFYMRSVFTEKWYNLIVPSVPPGNLDWYMVYKIMDEETRNNIAASLYIRHDLYGSYKNYLLQKRFDESADDVYLRRVLNTTEPLPSGIFREVTPETEKDFIRMGQECFPVWNTKSYSEHCFKLSNDLKNNGDKQNLNILFYEKDNPVSFGSLLYSKQLKLGYIHNIGTIISERRKGKFEKMIHYFMHVAASEGIEVLYANVENHGSSFHGFLKLCFQESCRYHLFTK